MNPPNIEIVTIRGITYDKFSDDEGYIYLKNYSKETKRWNVLKFAKETSPNLKEDILAILRSPNY